MAIRRAISYNYSNLSIPDAYPMTDNSESSIQKRWELGEPMLMCLDILHADYTEDYCDAIVRNEILCCRQCRIMSVILDELFAVYERTLRTVSADTIEWLWERSIVCSNASCPCDLTTFANRVGLSIKYVLHRDNSFI